jgi:hypothetical protein
MKVRRLDDFDRVTLAREERASDKGERTTYYSVRLDGRSVPLTLDETPKAEVARKQAAQVAEFLRFELVDFTKSGASKRALSERVFGTKDERVLSNPPPETRIDCERRDGVFVFKIPARGLRWWRWPLLIGLLSPAIAIGSFALVEANVFGPQVPAAVRDWLGIGIAATCLVYLPLLLAVIIPAARSMKRREEVYVSPEMIRVESRALDRRIDSNVPVDEILNLDVGKPLPGKPGGDLDRLYGPRDVVRVRGTLASLEFGGSLAHAERAWLRDAVASILLAET